MPRFTLDNTEGFHPVTLELLNAKFDHEVRKLGGEPEKSTLDHIAERVLADHGDEALLRTLEQAAKDNAWGVAWIDGGNAAR